MAAAALGLLAALCFSGANVASKKGVQDTSPLGGLFISLPTGLVAMLPAVWITHDGPPTHRALLLFAVAGLCAPGIGRLAGFSGLRRLDTSVHVPVQSSVHPLLAVTGGVVLFGERVGALRLMGIAGVVIGVWILCRNGAEAANVAGGTAPSRGAASPVKPRRRQLGLALLFPTAAGLAFGSADLIRHAAMAEFRAPALGTAVSILSALVSWTVLIGLSPALRAQLRYGRGSWWFVAHGFLTSSAILSAFSALSLGDVSLVSPLIASQPFIIIVMSHLFLREVETVTLNAVLGACFVVLGTVALALS